MKVYRAIADLDLDRTKSIALVPTMGAFHEGHLHLMREARKLANLVVVSLFVNPTQFRAGEDFEKYPRDEAGDFELADSVGVDAMFAPSVEEVYPAKTTKVHVGGLSESWEGAHRPGHFDGVATVVAKLFNICRPDFAVFGWKDFQQCRVIQSMVEGLNFPVALHFEPTVREADGLALSSRNRYLSSQERVVAPLLYATLCRVASDVRGASDEGEVSRFIDAGRRELTAAGFVLDYFEMVDSATLDAVRSVESWNRLIVAGRLGSTRLIDNISLFEHAE